MAEAGERDAQLSRVRSRAAIGQRPRRPRPHGARAVPFANYYAWTSAAACNDAADADRRPDARRASRSVQGNIANPAGSCCNHCA